MAFLAATRGVLDRQTALALRPALDQIGEVLDEASHQAWHNCCKRTHSFAHTVSYVLAQRSTLELNWNSGVLPIFRPHAETPSLAGS